MAGQVLPKVNDFLVKKGLPPIETRIDRLGLSPYPMWGLSSLCFASSISALKGAPGWPGMFPLAGFAGAFALSGYAVCVDSENGPSTATAWGLCYLFFCGKDAFKSLRPAPIALTAAVAGTTGFYAKEFLELWN